MYANFRSYHYFKIYVVALMVLYLEDSFCIFIVVAVFAILRILDPRLLSFWYFHTLYLLQIKHKIFYTVCDNILLFFTNWKFIFKLIDNMYKTARQRGSIGLDPTRKRFLQSFWFIKSAAIWPPPPTCFLKGNNFLRCELSLSK